MIRVDWTMNGATRCGKRGGRSVDTANGMRGRWKGKTPQPCWLERLKPCGYGNSLERDDECEARTRTVAKAAVGRLVPQQGARRRGRPACLPASSPSIPSPRVFCFLPTAARSFFLLFLQRPAGGLTLVSSRIAFLERESGDHVRSFALALARRLASPRSPTRHSIDAADVLTTPFGRPATGRRPKCV